MTKNNNAVLVEGLTKLVEGATSLIAFLKQQNTAQENEKPDVPAETPAKESVGVRYAEPAGISDRRSCP